MKIYAFDIESYSNYFLFAAKTKSSKPIYIELTKHNSILSESQKETIRKLFSSNMTIGFNSLKYDLIVLKEAFAGATVKRINNLSKDIIEKGVYHRPVWIKNHSDLLWVSPAIRIGLKLHGARMHFHDLKELPFYPHKIILPEDLPEIRSYCKTDLNITLNLYERLRERVDLRKSMTQKTGINMLSLSDSQIGEKILKKKFPTATPKEIVREFPLKLPKWIKVNTEDLKELVHRINSTPFNLDSSGRVILPNWLRKKVMVGEIEYQIGIGGLHSCNKKVAIKAPLLNIDVQSYYPNIILKEKLGPSSLGGFHSVYKEFVSSRIKAKKMSDVEASESLKIVINGISGKFGSPYSIAYSPPSYLTMTLIGQFALLMLIERLGDRVIYANTDGLIIDDNQSSKKILGKWEKETDFILEHTKWDALFMRDVNNYLLTHKNGKWKGKGIFTSPDIRKNPDGWICFEAARGFLQYRTPIADTVCTSKDLTKFLFVRTVNGGATWRERPIGRIIRWVWVENGDTITYKKNGNKVPKADGSTPVMDFITAKPKLDYERYIEQAQSILETVGFKNG